MSFIRRLLFVVLTLCVATAWGQSNKREPHIGYLYPSGGRQSSVVLITAGGQYLRGVTNVNISFEGVHASVIQYCKPLRFLKKEQRQLLKRRLKEVWDKRLAELPGKSRRRPMLFKKTFVKKRADKPGTSKKETAAKTEQVKLPDHPLLYDLDNKSLRELAHITNVLFFPRNKQQLNRQLAELVLIEITIDPGAKPGDRELRLGTKTGLTNPMVFQVGLFPEIRELEPNNRKAYSDL
ncbi:MAG: hypothetical protein E3J26_03475, partial [Candidatus Zixiibacteriota bacterium]